MMLMPFGVWLPVFLPLATVSLVARCLVALGFAAWIEEYIEIARAPIEEIWLPGTVLMVPVVALYRWKRGAPFKSVEDRRPSLLRVLLRNLGV